MAKTRVAKPKPTKTTSRRRLFLLSMKPMLCPQAMQRNSSLSMASCPQARPRSGRTETRSNLARSQRVRLWGDAV